MELLGGILLFLVCVWWIGFFGFIFFAICGFLMEPIEAIFDGISRWREDVSRWAKENELVSRYWTILAIKWILWRANRELKKRSLA